MKLVEEGTLSRIQNNLLESRQIRDIYGSWWFNIFMLLFVVFIVIAFMYSQFVSTRKVLESEATRKDIPIEGFAWNNHRIRNAIDM